MGTTQPDVFAMRERLRNNRQIEKRFRESNEALAEELRSICNHELVVVSHRGHFGSYDPVTDYDDTRPEGRTCIICGFQEVGKEVTVSGQRHWDFRVLTREPLTKTGNIVTLEEQETMRSLKDVLDQPLSELVEQLRQLGYNVS